MILDGEDTAKLACLHSGLAFQGARDMPGLPAILVADEVSNEDGEMCAGGRRQITGLNTALEPTEIQIF